ncbi:receptor-type tyrosine-protein kinase FLT3-like isoform X2 [Archocentrus centrarchus]|uniref:receptor-type tyrosine-protein kinase FLT3-like isoform X2 n=1 Tax=Archocentrus centrarchus TaxID=63155 RepID=UPI0011EA2405|nr:receptor-type tyrosine-protein kinase FLT3-like isoform X2 [Archocentrus centrarchus]
MPRHKNMIAGVLLLCVVRALCSDDGKTQVCVSSREAACFRPADYLNYLNASDPVSKELTVGEKLIISLEDLSESLVCYWMRGGDRLMTTDGNQLMVTPPLSETDSGEYTLTCQSSNDTLFSVTVILHVVMKRPTKPQLMLDGVDRPKTSPLFKCISEGSPHPTIEWNLGNYGGVNKTSNGRTESTITSSDFDKTGMMCCATNAEGQECSQMYDYDLERNLMNKDEVSNVTLGKGQSLLLRCRMTWKSPPSPVWEKGGEVLDASILSCKPEKEEMCIKNDRHQGSRMAYLSIRSLREEHSGTYTCKGPNKNQTSVYVHVLVKGFLSAQLDEHKIIPAQLASSTCLQASVSYNPVLQHCSWETPDKNMIRCVRETGVTQHRTVKLCDGLISGDYKLYLEAGGQKETKNISVCVVGKPKFKFSVNEANDTYTVETESLVPANYTWLDCSEFNESCETDSSWKEIPNAFQTDSDVSCNKIIQSSLSTGLVDGDRLKFCLTNTVGTWCEIPHIIYKPPPVQRSIGQPPTDTSLMLLKVCSMSLLMALVIVSIVLMYFVKKKKPQYQPQLQMIQMTGPSDNDYIYINFKDFEYDRKWEFPRENLELGKELGSGAFGMVVQATAHGIRKPGISQQVAVKMLKEKHQSMEKEALMSELKMLTHIGHHANIVNLLGACTDLGPIYLIFQYCCHGDLLNYLKNNSERYHKSVTDAFDKDRFRSLYQNLQLKKNPSELEAPVDNYIPMFGSTTRGQEDIALLTLNPDDMDNCRDAESVKTSDEQTEDLDALTFDDLLSFAFQVARGMEFLSSKNCIHRDLAARNVLVTKGRQVKIGDFGLARDIENDSNYVVRGNVRLPVKWMAPESIFEGMYTMKSDVWAYGILLWEIFSLGVTPYPGIKVDHMFYSMIERGFKMECPYYASETVYGMMCTCWTLDPAKRPSFSKLVSFICDQLIDREEKLYHNMFDQICGDYQNLSTTVDMSALMKQSEENKTPAANDYCLACATEENYAETSDSNALAAEKELLKPSDTE